LALLGSSGEAFDADNTVTIHGCRTGINDNADDIAELKSDLATILDGSGIDFDVLSSAVSNYQDTNANVGVLDVLNNLAARCTQLENVLDSLLNNTLDAVPALTDMPEDNVTPPP